MLKFFWDVFNNKSSIMFALVFVLPMIVGGVGTAWWKWNAWLDERDAKAKAEVEALHTAEELDREREARKIYQESYDRAADNQKKDQKKIAELTQFTETQKAVINEALNELDKLKGGDTVIPANRQRVLAIVLKRVKAEAAGDIQGDCQGDTTRCAVERLRNDLLR